MVVKIPGYSNTRTDVSRCTESECYDDCFLTEKSGDRVGQICKGHCAGTPLITGTVVYNCYRKE